MQMQPPNVVTTQRTAKRFKLMLLLGYVGVVASATLGWFCAARPDDLLVFMLGSSIAGSLPYITATCLVLSLALVVVSRGLIWWYHD